MTQDESGIAFDTTTIRAFPLDLSLTVLLVLLTGIAVLVPGIAMTRLRLVLGIPFLVFLPGYALVSALFPRRKDVETEQSPEANDAFRTGSGIGGFERVALSVGTSVAINSMIGFLLNFTPWGIRLVPTLVGICSFTVVTAVVAAVRRLRTPPAERFSVPIWYWAGRIRRELFDPETGLDAVLNVILVVSLILAVGSVAYAIGMPHQQESFTQFYVLGHDESGNPATEGYPQNLTVGESESLYVGIENHEHRRVNYTVVVLLQRFENNSTRAQHAEQLDRFRVSLASNQTTLSERAIDPTMRGNELRLTYLLYKGTPSKNPNPSTAYRTSYFWVNVSNQGRPPAETPTESTAEPYRR